MVERARRTMRSRVPCSSSTLFSSLATPVKIPVVHWWVKRTAAETVKPIREKGLLPCPLTRRVFHSARAPDPQTVHSSMSDSNPSLPKHGAGDEGHRSVSGACGGFRLQPEATLNQLT